ncbi:bifunctional folylpolyglutamate synthase/ dihydrofolate synthase [Nitzschia inconspicua]|uniref:Bifunctional folylpolyglutamate synthase/ dihydrofolate synthase n=1 Tax=Nitzschia inconspicua TaxID=303405 RepID=A0A9K3M6L0_9STRA|nr:bifunctional folylpolyglutamate synthase/ dihydrofolate synthase [Nitzschia inconspicua]
MISDTSSVPSAIQSKEETEFDDDDDEQQQQQQLYQSAVEALLSPLHQASSKEAIQNSAQRRVKTVHDMRYYWNKILRGNDHQQQQQQEEEQYKYTVKLIHITGTKGKGSTACMAESILRHHGYKTGLFTSPHLITVRERIRWNGKPIHPWIFGRVYWKLRKALELDGLKDDLDSEDRPPALPGYFRMLTLMGLYTFLYELNDRSIDVLILEVGMGGRYDATNFLDPNCFVNVAHGVTLLDLDHTRILGDTLEKIAWEKGGIFAVDKANTTVVSKRPNDDDDDDDKNTEQNDSASHPNAKSPKVIAQEDAKKTIRSTEKILSSDRKTFYILDSNTKGVLDMMASCARIEGHGGGLEPVDATGKRLKEALKGNLLGLAGEHQYGNATLAVTLCRAVTGNEDISVDSSLTKQGLVHACWPARCQTYQPSNDARFLYLLDGAHTPQSMTATVEWFRNKLTMMYSNPETRPNSMPILVFNTSHERNPLDLLQILIEQLTFLPPEEERNNSTAIVTFPRVYFAASDSSRPSPVPKATAQELLQEQGMELQPHLVVSSQGEDKEGNDNKSRCHAWQDTLATVYQHLVASRNVGYPDGTTSAEVVIHTQMTSAEVIQDIRKQYQNNTSGETTTTTTCEAQPIPVLVTGSLYLVGSFLDALKWEEESSPPK